MFSLQVALMAARFFKRVLSFNFSNMKTKISAILFIGLIIITTLISCNSNSTQVTEPSATDSLGITKDSSQPIVKETDSAKTLATKTHKAELSKVLIYNFHVTNRCVSCIAIEDATTKTINTYFANELKQGRIIRYILNVDEESNADMAEKYQAFGSGLFITRVYKGKETSTDLTGDGFKYAKNKEEKFIEILKNKISEYLK